MKREIFYVGQQFERGGVLYKILAGNRCDGDMVIEFRTPYPWYRPTIEHNLILSDFKFQVEENNYGPFCGKISRGRGGYYLLDAIKKACLDGWKPVADRIAQEVKNAPR